MESNVEKLMTVDEVADFLGLKVRTIYDKVQRRQIPHVRIGRTVRFRRSAIEAMVTEHPERAA